MPLLISRSTMVEEIQLFLTKENITLASIVYGQGASILKKGSTITDWPYLTKPLVLIGLYEPIYNELIKKYPESWPYPVIKIVKLNPNDLAEASILDNVYVATKDIR